MLFEGIIAIASSILTPSLLSLSFIAFLIEELTKLASTIKPCLTPVDLTEELASTLNLSLNSSTVTTFISLVPISILVNIFLINIPQYLNKIIQKIKQSNQKRT